MSKIFIEETTLTKIADAIRTKLSTSEPIPVLQMDGKILSIPSGGSGGGNEPTDAELTFSGDMSKFFANGKWNWLIKRYGDRITTTNVTDANEMFYNLYNGESYPYPLTTIPFSINFSYDPNTEVNLSYMFQNCHHLKSLPEMSKVYPNGINGMFFGCQSLTEINIDFIDWSKVESTTDEWSYYANQMFAMCYKLIKLPTNLTTGNPRGAVPDNSIYWEMCISCYALEGITDLPVIHYDSPMSDNMFWQSFDNCTRLADLTFKTNADGSPKVAMWANQHIQLYRNIGWGGNSMYYPDTTPNVVDDTTYQQYKNNPNWYTYLKAYSRYDYLSARRTLQSLPDTSAFLATNGGTNTITFSYNQGNKSGGDIYTNLSDAEIASAADKGWTVSFVQG